jgi:predicted NBD/HSP70 family sugar kinase
VGLELSVRTRNARDVLEALLVKSEPNEFVARDELAKRAGLARATVASVLEDLRDLEEARSGPGVEPIVVFSQPARVKRKPEHVLLNPTCGYIAAVDASYRKYTVGLGDLFGRIAGPNDWNTTSFEEIDQKPLEAIKGAAAALKGIVGNARAGRIAGIGIAVAAPVDPFSALIRPVTAEEPEDRPVSVPPENWVGLDVRAKLQEQLGWDCGYTIANDANLATWNEFFAAQVEWALEHNLAESPDKPGLLNFLLIRWSSGLGSGLIVNGRSYIGPQGLAGEMGHVRYPGIDAPTPDDICRQCGRPDCLENLIGYGRLRKILGIDKGTPREIVDAMPEAQKHLVRYARHLGRALGGTISTLNPQVIAISGPTPLPGLREDLAREFSAGLEDTATPASFMAVKKIYFPTSHWADIDDERGRLAVLSGAIRRARHFFALEYVWRQLNIVEELPEPRAA